MSIDPTVRAEIRKGLTRLFPGGPIDDLVIDAFVDEVRRSYPTEATRLGVGGPAAPPPALPPPNTTATYYLANARHQRHVAPYSDFTGHLPMVRVPLAADGHEPIHTEIGSVEVGDHLLFNLREVARQYGVGRMFGYDPQKVELITPPRQGHRFSAVSVLLCYRNATDTDPTSYALEAGLAQGGTRVLYGSPAMNTPIDARTGYWPTPTSQPDHWYLGTLVTKGPELVSLGVAASEQRGQSPYISIHVDFDPLGTTRVLPIFNFLVAGMRVAAVANAIDQKVPDMAFMPLLQNVMGALGVAPPVPWHTKPHRQTQLDASAGARKTPVSSYAGERTWDCVPAPGPQSLDELAQQVALIGEQGNLDRVRARGALHSSSDCPSTTGVLFDMTQSSSEVEEADDSRLKKTGSYIEIGAGASIDKVNRELDKLGLSLPAMGNFTGQTFIGAMSTGTHGCSLTRGSLPTIVRSVLMVDGQGKKKRIEPAREPLTAKVEDGVELVVNDDVFDAAVTGYGSLGIIWSVIVEAVPQFHMIEDRRPTTWAAVRQELLDGQPAATLQQDPRFAGVELDGWSLSINAYANGPQGNHSAVAFNWYKATQAQATGLPNADGCWAEMLLSWIFQQGLLDVWSSHPERAPNDIETGFTSPLAYGPRLVGDVANRIMGRTFGGHPPRGFGTEVTMPYDFGSGPAARDTRKALVDAVERLFAAVQVQKQNGLYLRGYVALRFVRPTYALLSPHQGDPEGSQGWACIEMVTMSGNREVVNQNVLLLGRLEEALRGPKARPHLGLVNTLLASRCQQLWPDTYDRFRAVRKALDPKGKFDNELTRKLGL